MYIFLWMSLSFGNWKSRNARQFTWFSTNIGELDAQQLRILVKKSTIAIRETLKHLYLWSVSTLCLLIYSFHWCAVQEIFFGMFFLIICHKLIYKNLYTIAIFYYGCGHSFLRNVFLMVGVMSVIDTPSMFSILRSCFRVIYHIRVVVGGWVQVSWMRNARLWRQHSFIVYIRTVSKYGIWNLS